MKNRVIFFTGILLLCFGLPIRSSADTSSGKTEQNVITIYASPELFTLASQWASQYALVENTLKFNVIKANSPDEIQENGIGLFENVGELHRVNPAAWSMVVGRDIVVPIMNDKNPLAAEICSGGLVASGLARLADSNGVADWKNLLKVEPEYQGVPLHVYLMNDPDVISSVSGFIKKPAGVLHARMVENQDELIAAIQRDPGALGFGKLTGVVNKDHGALAENLKLVPIDKNENGRIDFMEDIYSSVESLSKGVWIGKYPKVLSGNIYAVSTEKPRNELEINFLNWILTQGQNAVAASGFSELAYSERQSQLNKINTPEAIANVQPNEAKTWVKLLLWTLLGFILISFVLDRIFRRRPRVKIHIPDSQSVQAFEESSVVVPPGIYFDKTHTWAFMKKNGLVKVGIDDFLQHVTGPITRIEMKKPGTRIRKGEILLTVVQSGKQLAVYSPVSGTITAVNKSLHQEPSQINSAPYNAGWVYLIEPLNWQLETQFMFVAEKYKSWLKQEFIRLKNFLNSAVRVTSPEFNQVVMQDGGSLRDNVLSGLSPEVWDDFQTEFLDGKSKQTI